MTKSLLNMPVEPMIAPSILAADYANMGAEVSASERGGAALLHLDVMDGHFVPNLSLGPGLIKSLRPVSGQLFDAHLMISDPGRYIQDYVKVGVEHITIHVESNGDLLGVLNQIHEAGLTAGISLRPGTSVESLYPYLPHCEMALVMTVEPGFGGQSFMPDQLEKVRKLRRWSEEHHQKLHIQVDGGISAMNIRQVYEAGANIFVAGSSVFRPGMDPADNTQKLLAALK